MHTYFYHNSQPYYQEHLEKNEDSRVLVKDFTLTALCLSKTQDIVQISSSKKKDYDWLNNHFKVCKLGVSQNILCSDEQLPLPKGFKLSQYKESYGSGTYSPSEYFDNKKNFLEFAKNNDGAIPSTKFYDCMTEIKSIDHPVMLKTNVSSAGSGSYFIESTADLKRVPRNTPLHVQEYIQDIKSSMSLQYIITPAGYTYLGATKMFIDKDFAWIGCCPSEYDAQLLVVYNQIVKKMHDLGLRGPLSLDFLQRCSGKFVVLECNPRFGGGTYPSMLAQRLNITQWLYRKFKIQNFKQLESINQKHNIFYNPVTQKGILVLHWEKDRNIICNIFIAGNDSEQEAIIKTLAMGQVIML